MTDKQTAVASIQMALTNLQYYQGEITGAWGDSAEAFDNFLKDHSDPNRPDFVSQENGVYKGGDYNNALHDIRVEEIKKTQGFLKVEQTGKWDDATNEQFKDFLKKNENFDYSNIESTLKGITTIQKEAQRAAEAEKAAAPPSPADADPKLIPAPENAPPAVKGLTPAQQEVFDKCRAMPGCKLDMGTDGVMHITVPTTPASPVVIPDGPRTKV